AKLGGLLKHGAVRSRCPRRGLAYKHVASRWHRPHSLVDDFNLRRRQPDIHDQWMSERRERLKQLDEAVEFGEVEPAAAAAESAALVADISGLPRRLRRRLNSWAESGFPPPANAQEAGRDYQRACIGRFGAAATGLEPSACWPEPDQLAEATARDRWLEGDLDGSGLAGMLSRRAEAAEERRRRLAELDARIDAGLARMPEELAKFEARQARARQAKEEAAAAKLAELEEARDHFGFRVDAQDDKFIRLKEARSEEAKKEKKAKKKAEKKAEMEGRLVERVREQQQKQQSEKQGD
ncbi:hypothetical protein BOX15_Mlig005219g1, partial [Macrostomum lignano]